MLKLCNRLPSQTPVSPATTPDQPLGVAATTLPKRSATTQVVVSCASATGGGIVPPGRISRRVEHRLARAGIARPPLERGMFGVDQPSPLARHTRARGGPPAAPPQTAGSA